ncbi:hypothetical protein COOONC_13421, partial [Cooperia oncophora]
MVSSEFIVEFHKTWDTAIVQGCYHCAGGALAKVRCTSATEIFGEVLCTEHAFVIPCAPHGPESELRFHLDSARQILNCTISCGRFENGFLITGVLKYVNTFHYPGMATLDVNNTVFNEFQWPDFGHIIDTILTWYKTLLIAVVAVALAVALTYLYVSTCDMEDIRRDLNEVREAVQAMHNAIDELSALVRQNPEQRQAGEAPAQQEERQIIAENAPFMEEVEDAGDDVGDETSDDDSDDSDSSDSNDGNNDEQQAQPEDPRNIEEPRANQRNARAEDRQPVNQAHNVRTRRQVLLELRRLRRQQVVSSYTIQDLMRQPFCQRRLVERGVITRQRDRHMRCAFCDAVGEHYSDSCPIVRTSPERRMLLLREGK